jgi:hypothetical protein
MRTRIGYGTNNHPRSMRLGRAAPALVAISMVMASHFSGDTALDRAAWGGITASNPFPPLPTDFGGQYLALRFRFYYNPDKGEMEQQ